MEKKTMLVAEHIDKRFGMTHAVNDVSINIAAGEVRALIGENGSGKSTFCQMLCFGRDIFAVQAPCQHTYHRMGNAGRTSGGTNPAIDTVEGFLRTFCKVSPLCIGNVLHYFQTLRTSLGTCVTADAAVDLRIQLHHDTLLGADLFHVIGSLIRREEGKCGDVHPLLHLRLAGQTCL